jgi:hypothetical protein
MANIIPVKGVGPEHDFILCLHCGTTVIRNKVDRLVCCNCRDDNKRVCLSADSDMGWAKRTFGVQSHWVEGGDGSARTGAMLSFLNPAAVAPEGE